MTSGRDPAKIEEVRRKPSNIVVDWRENESAERRSAVEAEIHRVTAELVRRGASLVVLFGSRARDEAGSDSDADILAVLPLPEDRPQMARLADLYAEIAPRGIDLFAYTPAEFEVMKRTSSLVYDALEEGVVLHAS